MGVGTDTSRFPSGVLIRQALTEARPIGTIVLNSADNQLYRSISFPVAGYVALSGATAGASPVVTRTAFVDPVLGNNATGAFGGLPFQTIQAAINAVPAAVSAATAHPWTIVVAPTSYDESLAITLTARRIVLTSWGPWNLGLFAGAGGTPSTTRNVVVAGSTAAVGGVSPGLVIQAFTPTTEQALNGARISGQINFAAMVGATAVELICQAEVFDTGATGESIDAGTVTLEMTLAKCRFATSLFGTNAVVVQAEGCVFDGLVDVMEYRTVSYCKINAGWRASVSTSGAFVDCDWTAGNFNGMGTGNLRGDDYTLNSFYENGNIVGAATVVPLSAGQSSQRTATSVFTTTSASDTLIVGGGGSDDMQFLSPPASNYLVTFSGQATISATGRNIEVSVYVNAVQQSGAERKSVVPVAGQFVNLALAQLVTVDGNDDISIQTSRDGGAVVTVTWDDRSMQITRMYGPVS
jgi:hypothetical protein